MRLGFLSQCAWQETAHRPGSGTPFHLVVLWEWLRLGLPILSLPTTAPWEWSANVRGVTSGCLYSGSCVVMPHGPGRALIGMAEVPVEWQPRADVSVNTHPERLLQEHHLYRQEQLSAASTLAMTEEAEALDPSRWHNIFRQG